MIRLLQFERALEFGGVDLAGLHEHRAEQLLPGARDRLRDGGCRHQYSSTCSLRMNPLRSIVFARKSSRSCLLARNTIVLRSTPRSPAAAPWITTASDSPAAS